jgi:hypothetical protein
MDELIPHSGRQVLPDWSITPSGVLSEQTEKCNI